MALGRHALIDIYDVKKEELDNILLMENLMKESVKEANLTAVDSRFFKFEPYGLSGVVFLKESHVAVHTWPEYNFLSVDAFTCGTNMNPEEVCIIIAKKLNSKNYNIRKFDRGNIEKES